MPNIIRPIRIVDNTAYVTLTQGYKAIIDISDVDKISNFNWHACVKDHAVYAFRGGQLNKIKFRIPMHHVILPLIDGYEVDHINLDTLDNRFSNLRYATRQQNASNRGLPKNNSTGIKGVGWHKASKKWRATITCGQKSFHIGLFENQTDAVIAYNDAAKRLHGEFARLNLI